MENKAVNKILEAEAQGAQKVNEAYDEAERIIENSREDAKNLANEMRLKQLEENKKTVDKAVQKGQTKAAVIKTDYNDEAERLKTSSAKKKEQAIQAVLEIVLQNK